MIINNKVLDKLQNTILDTQGWHKLMGESLQIKVRNKYYLYIF